MANDPTTPKIVKAQAAGAGPINGDVRERPSAQAVLSAARLTVAVKRARADAGPAADLLLSEPIAIVGMGCRFPGGATSLAEYWRLLDQGRSGIAEIDGKRWPDAGKLELRLRMGGYLNEIDRFDPEFFAIAPREAASIDPQQRLLMEVCWEAMSDAGIAPTSLSGSKTGVFLAIYNTDYSRLQMREGAPIESHTGVGSAHSVAAGRLSFLLNLRGPSIAVDTACSSSLVATHLACQSLRQRECNVALVGGVSLKLLSDEVRAFAQWGMLAHDGRNKTFDAAADGFVPGEGCGVIVLKRLSEAIAHGDPIRAVIRGAAVNHDGRSSVLTAPNGPAQEAVIREALCDARVSPGDVSFVEAHGTGTSLGDPIEVEALDAVYGAPAGGGSEAGQNCAIGAVKSNLGHLEAAAGLAGLIKIVLALEHQSIPRNLNFERLNPQIRLNAASRIKMAIEAQPWPRSAQPRFAAVSSFGLGGTNAHVVLEEAPLLPRANAPNALNSSPLEYCLPISSHTGEGLKITAHAFAELLRKPDAMLPGIAQSAALGRDHAAFRLAVTASSAEEAAEKLESRVATRIEPAADASSLKPSIAMGGAAKVAFVFSGQGSVWLGMMSELLAIDPVGAEVFAACERMVLDSAGWSLRDAADDPLILEDTAKAQPLLFALQVTLVRVLEQWGVRPDAVAGHSVGEVAAAVTAGFLSLEQGMQLVIQRGQRMGERVSGMPPGRMLAAEMSAEKAATFLVERIQGQAASLPELAAINGDRSVVFSGAEAAMEKLADELASQEIHTRWLDVRYAFHSAAMDSARQRLEADLKQHDLEADGTRRGAPVALISTVTGEPWSDGDGDTAYWARGVRQPVLFQSALHRLLQQDCRIFIEIGPHPVLLRSVAAGGESQLSAGDKVTALAGMRRGHSARSTLMQVCAALYELGYPLGWAMVYSGPREHADLPGYAWNRKRYWLAEMHVAPRALASDDAMHELLGSEISSSFVEGKLWQTMLSTQLQPWLQGHRWQGEPVFPFAAWLEVARRVTAAAMNPGDGHDAQGVTLREFAVQQPLKLGAQSVALQTLLTSGRELKLAAQVNGEWQRFASGFWESDGRKSASETPGARSFDLHGWQSRATRIIESEDLYRELTENGLSYGPAFRLLEWVRVGPGFALAAVNKRSGEDGSDVEDAGQGPGLQPTLLDACLQAFHAAQPAEYRQRAVLPVSVRSYRVSGKASEVYALIEMRSASEEGAEADVTIVDREGRLVAEIEGLRARAANRANEHMAPMWQMVWRKVAVDEHAVRSAGALPGSTLVWLVPGVESDPSTGGRSAQQRLLVSIAAAIEDTQAKVVRVTSIDATTASAAIVLAGTLTSVNAQLLEVVAIEQERPGWLRQLVLLTRGAVEVENGEDVDAEQAALMGMMRSFRAEYPGIAVRLVDLPHSGAAAEELAFASLRSRGEERSKGMLAAEAALVARWLTQPAGQAPSFAGPSQASNQESEEVALRHGMFFAPKLEAYHPVTRARGERVLALKMPGLLESLAEESWTAPKPAADEVQIECRAHGLNFRDVLTALGSYAGVAAAFGGECAGVVTKAGGDCDFAPGDEVMAFAPASLRSVANVKARYVVAKPAAMSFAQAATIPVAFLTAHYAFSRLAELKHGQSVLVHSAAGGLGQAAVQLARRSGATVFASAGTAEKRAYLFAQGVDYVFDSRSESFAEEVLRATGGRGVDVVLNSLSGDRIGAGFHALSRGGAFLEVGKRDIWTPEQAAALRPDVRYWAFDLGEVAERAPALIAAMWQELLPWFAVGELAPLPYEIFSLDKAESAFRYMASGKHVGKLVLMQPARPLAHQDWQLALRDGTVLITGGTGALGLATARWLLGQGARSLVLVSRSSSAQAASLLEAEYAERGARVIVERADVCDRAEMVGVLAQIADRDAPLSVVIHAAGEVDDRLLSDHTPESFRKSMSIKVEGARILDELTQDEPIVRTIYFSSVAALLGSAGQSSYAAANAYLDGLAERRTALGKSTLSVNWGAWAEGGMVKQLTPNASARLARQGVQAMPPATALAALGHAVLSGLSRTVIAAVDWSAYQEQFPRGSASQGFYRALLPARILDSALSTNEDERGNQPRNELHEIANAVRSERLPRMEAFVRESARKALGLSSSRPMPLDLPLQELGLDSLLALELRNMLAQSADRPLSATLLFDYPTIRGLSQHLLELILPQKAAIADTPPIAGNGSGRRRFEVSKGDSHQDLTQISDAEAEELLLAELDHAGARRAEVDSAEVNGAQVNTKERS